MSAPDPHSGVPSVIDRLLPVLRTARLDLTDEIRCQGEIAAALEAGGIGFAREHRLGARERIDFFVEGFIGVEVKMNAARPAGVHRQLERYAQHDAIRALVLVTNRAMGLPPEILGKPVWYVAMGRAWL